MTIAGQSGGLRITAGGSGVPNIIGGAAANVVESSVNGAVIAGGGAADSPNVVQADFSSIGGGSSNWIGAGAVFAVIGGGNGNTNNAVYGTLGGGFQNFVSGQGATVAGGSQNSASGNYSFIAGGMSNVVSGWYSFAAGQNASATNDHCFVWSDGSKDAFSSTSFYQFLIQASGGVGINTNDPSGFLLNVAGSVHAADYYGNGATL